jgi:hypothetical protein
MEKSLQDLINQYPLVDNEPYVAIRGNETILKYLNRLLAIGVITSNEYERYIKDVS